RCADPFLPPQVGAGHADSIGNDRAGYFDQLVEWEVKPAATSLASRLSIPCRHTPPLFLSGLDSGGPSQMGRHATRGGAKFPVEGDPIRSAGVRAQRVQVVADIKPAATGNHLPTNPMGGKSRVPEGRHSSLL